MEHLHKNHRERLKDRFLAEGLTSFSAHNVLELVLFYSIPRKDTNEIAHELINRFGSLAGVLEAPVEELTTVPGVGKNSAVLIHAILAIMQRYMQETANTGTEACDTVERLLRYAALQYHGVHRETTKLILLDNRLRIMDCVTLAEGTCSRAEINTRQVVETAIRRNAPMVVLMHNHPYGSPAPSSEDYEATLRLQSICEAVGVRLLEHLLIGTNEIRPMLHEPRGKIGKDGFVNDERPLQAEK